MKKGEVAEIVTNWNIQAMKFLKLGNPFSAFNLLQKASKLLSSHKSFIDLHMVTLNNLGCYYKWVKKPKEALKQFENSAYLRKNYSVEPIGLAGTFLNISSLHSDMGNHNLALKYAQDAVNLLKSAQQNSVKLRITLAMAYHSLANEQSNLKNFQEAFENFEKSLNLALETPGSGKLADFVKSSMRNAEKKAGFGKEEKSYDIEILKDKIKNKNRKSKEIKLYRKKDKNEEVLDIEERDQSNESKKLPGIYKNHDKDRFTPPLPSASNTRQRFITGDRLKPMFPQSVSPIGERVHSKDRSFTYEKSVNIEKNEMEEINYHIEKSQINETLETIQNKISLLESRLESFNRNIEPLKELENFNYDETFSPRTLDCFRQIKERNEAAKIIQNHYRKFIKIDRKTSNS